MPRTAPTVDGTPDYVEVSWRFVDANAQPGSFNVKTTSALATSAAIEAATEALGNMTNANLYAVVVGDAYADGGSPAGAVEAPRESVKDIINVLFKGSPLDAAFDVEVPAPLDSLFTEGTNDVIPDSTEMLALRAAFNTLLPTQYIPVSVRFTERKKSNKRTKI